MAFGISDPKPRMIHKASVRDRVLHHAIYRVLYSYFDRRFIADAFSSRDRKGTHRGILRFEGMARKVSKNNTRTCWVLKCDIRKFFATIDHEILFRILERQLPDGDTFWLLRRVIDSFEAAPGKGLPLGNLTSQLLVNVYMNVFDQYAKHELRKKFYVRYADDFVFLSAERSELESAIQKIEDFLQKNLKLALHPDKVYIKTWASGVDFLGWVSFPDHRVLRTTTKRRMLKRIATNPSEPTMNSYFGMLQHGNAKKLTRSVQQGLILD